MIFRPKDKQKEKNKLLSPAKEK